MGPQSILLIAATLLWPAGFLFLARLTRRPPHSTTAHPPATLSIIIPARNEAQNLPTLLASIKAQTCRPLEVIVVDDGSTDATPDIARQCGATLLTSQPLPAGWHGKPWACHQGSRAARGQSFLFLDADTWLLDNGLSLTLSQFQSGAISVAPYHEVRRPYEQLSAFFNLIMVIGTLPHGLFGQMLLVDRASYERVGGHEAVKQTILENFRLAQRFHHAGIPTRSLSGKGILAFRMYPAGLRQLIEGWTKAFASGAGHTPKLTLLLVIAWLTAMILPLGTLADPRPAAVVYALYLIQLAILFRCVGRFRWYTAVFYPAFLLFFFALFAWSLLRSGKRVTWKGRTIRAD